MKEPSVPRGQPCLSSANGTDKTWKSSRSRSVTDSPRSVDGTRNRQFSSPLRMTRNVQSPGQESVEESTGLRLDRDTYQYVFQDIVSIKTMLLKLKRVLQEAETLNPFDNTMKNGLFCNLNEGGTTDVSTSPGSGGSSIADELADLRRQVVFLQGQVEDKDRTIQVLQFQMSKLQGPNGNDTQTCGLSNNNGNIPTGNTCNAATQTEKTRPVSAGPSLLQTLPQDGVMGPLVSWSDSWERQRGPLLGEGNSNGRSGRKAQTDRLPRTTTTRQQRQQQEQSSSASTGTVHHRQNVGTQQSSPSSKRTQKPRDNRQESTENEQQQSPTQQQQHRTENKSEQTRSFIPTPRKLTTPTLLQRNPRTVPLTGRAHNT